MPDERKYTQESLIPTQPDPEEGGVFSRHTLDVIGAGLYSLASMLVGEGEDSIRLVENAISRAEFSACSDERRAHQSSRRALCSAAIETLAQRNPRDLEASQELEQESRQKS